MYDVVIRFPLMESSSDAGIIRLRVNTFRTPERRIILNLLFGICGIVGLFLFAILAASTVSMFVLVLGSVKMGENATGCLTIILAIPVIGVAYPGIRSGHLFFHFFTDGIVELWTLSPPMTILLALGTNVLWFPICWSLSGSLR